MSRHVLDRPAVRDPRTARPRRLRSWAAMVALAVATIAPPAGGSPANAIGSAATPAASGTGEPIAVSEVGTSRWAAESNSEATESAAARASRHAAERADSTRTDRRERLERRRARALARLGEDWRSDLPGWSIVFRPRRGPALAMTEVDEQRIVVRLHRGARPARIARVAAHELGHAYDVTHLDTLARRAWKAARGLGDDVAWWPTAGGSDFATGAGDFAECHATFLVGGISRSTVAGPCTETDLALLRELLATDHR